MQSFISIKMLLWAIIIIELCGGAFLAISSAFGAAKKYQQTYYSLL
ncbi:MAG: purine-cytosine permease-like protein [Cellvibrionaceae bacterium]|jgi:purine-cytosine permease-like protein